MLETGKRILIVDDDPSLTEALTGLLRHKGFDVSSAATGAAALDHAEHRQTELVLLDLRLGTESGLDILPRLKALRPEMSVIVLTAVGTIETAVEAMRLGADNFVIKPLDPPQLLAVVTKGLDYWALRRRSQRLERLHAPVAAAASTESRAMREALRLADAVAARDTTVLLLGETGTGKGMLARMIHEASARSHEPFVELNCAGLSRELTESELFGHERGAFTGASARKLGLFEVADGGTLLLDEIGEMESTIQAKLLKVLEGGRFRRVGGVAEIEVDVRLIAATHRDLDAEIEAGSFRRDLLFRLNVFSIRLPALRERTEEILPLAQLFFREHRGDADVESLISDDAAERLLCYGWPGNVRELRNVMERAAILCPAGSPLTPAHLPPLEKAAAKPSLQPAPASVPTMKDSERILIEQALRKNGGNILVTARELGISRGTLYRKAKMYGIVVMPDADPT